MAVQLFKPLLYGHLFLLQRSGNSPRNVAAYRNFHCKVKKTSSTKVCFRSHQEDTHQTRVVENVLSMMFFVSVCWFFMLPKIRFVISFLVFFQFVA